MSKKVCVFVDGENFRHSIHDLFESLPNATYLPPNANWGTLFDMFIDKTEIIDDGERVRAYWYVIENVDCYPYKFPSAAQKTSTLQNLLCRDDHCEQRLAGLTGGGLVSEMTKIVAELQGYQRKIRDRFRGWHSMQDRIARETHKMEFRRAGAIRFDAFKGSFGKEKAVDVKLATDLIVLKDCYDIAVIVSGDQDYVPAVKVVKDMGKHVVNIVFKTRSGKLLPGGARRLNDLTDECVEIKSSDMATHLNL